MARPDRGGKNIMYAVIETGGKQYRVQEGDVITVEKLKAEAGDKVTGSQTAIYNGADRRFRHRSWQSS